MKEKRFPTSLAAFKARFRDDAACLEYVAERRWPDGFVCPKCGVEGEPYRFAKRPRALRCRSCKADAYVTAGTVLRDAHVSVRTWFIAAYMVATSSDVSATTLQRQLGLSRYETAFSMLKKLTVGVVKGTSSLVATFDRALGLVSVD